MAFEGRDAGAEADRPNSGSTVVYASPGATFALRPGTKIYGFVQAPLYQDYNGLQLAPRVAQARPDGAFRHGQCLRDLGVA